MIWEINYDMFCIECCFCLRKMLCVILLRLSLSSRFIIYLEIEIKDLKGSRIFMMMMN